MDSGAVRCVRDFVAKSVAPGVSSDPFNAFIHASNTRGSMHACMTVNGQINGGRRRTSPVERGARGKPRPLRIRPHARPSLPKRKEESASAAVSKHFGLALLASVCKECM
jgi:hypothetical protein